MATKRILIQLENLNLIRAVTCSVFRTNLPGTLAARPTNLPYGQGDTPWRLVHEDSGRFIGRDFRTLTDVYRCAEELAREFPDLPWTGCDARLVLTAGEAGSKRIREIIATHKVGS